ncbi:hypothetical protein NQZ68_020254 [Dissostichus eleginoides]|nr:hypothetical protein NQZ68_020254 [Dissostichus eleginoides]
MRPPKNTLPRLPSSPAQCTPTPRPNVMAEEDQQPPPDRGASSMPGLLTGLQGAEASALQLRIKNSIW